MYSRMAEISRSEGRLPEGKQAEDVASQLASPSMEEICFRAMTGSYLSPESTIVAYWRSRGEADWPGVIATFASDVNQRFKDESLAAFPAPVEKVQVNGIVSLNGNEDSATVGYEVELLSRKGYVRRAAFWDSLVVERGGWRLRHREPGLK